MEVEAAGLGPSSLARARGRQASQLRTLVCERSILSRADGSAKWTQDGTVVLAAVHGPRQAKIQKEDAERAVIEVVFKPRSGMQDHKDKQMEIEIRGVLEGVVPLGLHPRTSIMVVLQVLQDDGSLLACALNAACTALVDAGVPMNIMFVSVACALAPSNQLLLDPDSQEEQAAQARFCFTFPFHYDMTKQVAPADSADAASPTPSLQHAAIGSHCSGLFTTDNLFDAFELCLRGSEAVVAFGRLLLTKSLQPAT